jgi:hypothetical protein
VDLINLERIRTESDSSETGRQIDQLTRLAGGYQERYLWTPMAVTGCSVPAGVGGSNDGHVVIPAGHQLVLAGHQSAWGTANMSVKPRPGVGGDCGTD